MHLPTWEFWAHQFLKQLLVPDTLRGENMVAILSAMRTENTTAQWNPLSTGYHMANDVPLPNGAPTRQYPTFSDGMVANVQTLLLPNYAHIRELLKKQPKAEVTCAAWTASDWGTKIDPALPAWVRAHYDVFVEKPLLSTFPVS